MLSHPPDNSNASGEVKGAHKPRLFHGLWGRWPHGCSGTVLHQAERLQSASPWIQGSCHGDGGPAIFERLNRRGMLAKPPFAWTSPKLHCLEACAREGCGVGLGATATLRHHQDTLVTRDSGLQDKAQRQTKHASCDHPRPAWDGGQAQGHRTPPGRACTAR